MEFEIKNGFLRKYIGNDSVVIIPDGVTEIDSYAFGGRDDILEITLPESVVKVWSYAFAECKGLEKVNVLGSPIIGEGAFYRCVNLKELNAPRNLKGFNQGAFAGCYNLVSPELSGKTFELYTLNRNRSLEEISYLRDSDISKVKYSWEEYKKITAETLNYVLIYSTDHCDELLGPETPEVEEHNTPIIDNIIVVKDGHFVGCALEKKYFGDIHNKSDRQDRLVLLKPSNTSVSILSASGANLPHCAYVYVDAFFRRCDNPNGWVGIANSIHKVK